ncbi:helix-turn-helix domain-containing protein [Mucilaginibacter pineti]|uniref:helix-turn-helix domain-containing protein n=1 Tax=Mucilaginibacter pineti TaxID=1391627 RepID=UPI00115F888D
MHRDIHPYTFLPGTKAFRNRGTKQYNENPHTVGGHIRKKRIEGGLSQKEAAKSLGVTEDCVTYWENGRSAPQVRHYPAIIRFLGYYPFDHETESLAGMLTQIRYCCGLSFRACASLLCVSEDGARRWERGRPVAHPKTRLLIERAWQHLPNRLPSHRS